MLQADNCQQEVCKADTSAAVVMLCVPYVIALQPLHLQGGCTLSLLHSRVQQVW
jgi:hypothetical protein